MSICGFNIHYLIWGKYGKRSTRFGSNLRTMKNLSWHSVLLDFIWKISDAHHRTTDSDQGHTLNEKQPLSPWFLNCAKHLRGRPQDFLNIQGKNRYIVGTTRTLDCPTFILMMSHLHKADTEMVAIIENKYCRKWEWCCTKFEKLCSPNACTHLTSK